MPTVRQLSSVESNPPGENISSGGPWLDGRMRMVNAAIGYAASAVDGAPDTYVNVAKLTLEAMTAYAEDVRAARQLPGGIPVPPAS